MDTNNWGLEVKPYGWPGGPIPLTNSPQVMDSPQVTSVVPPPKVWSSPKQQQSKERFITFYKQGETNVQDREVKYS